MIIAVPTGIKIFSWLSNSFSKNYLAKQLYLNIYSYFEINNLYESFPRANKNYIPHNTTTKSIVVYGSNLCSTIKYPPYTKIIRHMVGIPNSVLYPLIGILLSDGCITINASQKSKIYINEKCKYPKDIPIIIVFNSSEILSIVIFLVCLFKESGIE